MDCRELTASIDALVSLVAAHETPSGGYHAFNDAEVQRLNELDTGIYVLAQQASLTLPPVSMGRRTDCQPYGNLRIPSFRTSSGRYFIATDNWRQAMAGLRARAEYLIGEAARATASPVFTMLDRFPANPAGHVAFLEFVRDEVHLTAEAKRSQFAQGYCNVTLESMLRGIHWAEARARLTALPEFPAEVRQPIDAILGRELTTGTAERIDELLKPAVEALRESYEQARAGAIQPASQPANMPSDAASEPAGGTPEQAESLPESNWKASDEVTLTELASVLTGDRTNEVLANALRIVNAVERPVGDRLADFVATVPHAASLSSRELAQLLRVSHTAIQGTSWWKSNRAGQHEEKVEQRKDLYRQRGETYERGFESN